MRAGDRVRLVEAAEGLPAGREGRIVGWYRTRMRLCLVDFGCGNVVEVVEAALEPAEARSSDDFSRGLLGSAQGPLPLER
jgi:hypothetical protein